MVTRRYFAVAFALALALAPAGAAAAQDWSIRLPPPPSYTPITLAPAEPVQPPSAPTPPVIYWPPPLNLNPLLPPNLMTPDRER